MSSNSTGKLRVVLTNDDGPPGPESPYVFGFYRHLTQDLGWDVKVVVPSTQKSWIGKAYQIKDTIRGRYYYPKDTDGKGETSPSSRSLREGELGEWILLDATPASCSNIALHNLFSGEIDLVVGAPGVHRTLSEPIHQYFLCIVQISGPNYGRNTSSAFSLSSGTIGAALAASLSGVRAIALSYGIMIGHTPTTFHDPAFRLSSQIINHLLNNWGRADVLYSINIPMVEKLLHDDGLKIYWTSVWRNHYRRLFKKVPGLADNGGKAGEAATADANGLRKGGGDSQCVDEEESLVFVWQPDFTGLLNPTSAPEGSDGWALAEGAVSVTPLLTGFAELPENEHGFACPQDREWKFKL